MRIAIVTNDSPFAVASLRRFAREQATNVVAIVVTTTMPGAKSNSSGLMTMLRESGIGYVMLKVWINVVTPIVARVFGAKPSLTALLSAHGCTAEVRKVVRADDPATVEWLNSLGVDVLLSAGATHRFNADLLAVPRHVAVNMHPSLLPKYAGTDPYFWCLRNGDAATGVSLHITAPKLDAGDIVAQRVIDLTNIRSVSKLILRMWDENDAMLSAFFESGADVSGRRPQDLSQRSFYKRPGRSDIRALRQQGRRLLDPRSAWGIVRTITRIRAAGSRLHQPSPAVNR